VPPLGSTDTVALRYVTAMGSGDKKTIAGVVVGLAAGGVYMTGPLAFPGVPVAVWQSFFLAMVATLAISAVYFALVHTIKEDRAMPISLMVVGGMIFFVGAIWLGVVNERKPLLAGANKVTGVLSQPSNTPDVIARFVYPKSPALVLVNRSDKIARQIKWSAAIWNLDDPRTYVNPNPPKLLMTHCLFPSLLRLLEAALIRWPSNHFNEQYIKPGQRLFGSISVICPECSRGHTYVVSIIWGTGGWYTEILDRRDGELVISQHFTKDLVAAYHEELQKKSQSPPARTSAKLRPLI
jgi:hypothetical protein